MADLSLFRTPDELLADIAAALRRGATVEARALARDAMGIAAHAGNPAALLGQLARLEARAALLDGDPDAALDALTAAIAIADCVGDAAAAAHALNNTAIVHFQRGDLDAAEELYLAARARARDVGDVGVVANATLNLGVVANVRGDLRRARAHYRRALVDFRALGHAPHVVRTLNNLGLLYGDLRQWDRAEEAYAEALAICARTDDVEATARLHGNLAEVFVARGDVARARAACADGLATCDRADLGSSRGELCRVAGMVAREEGAFDEAERHLADAERIAEDRADLLLLAETAREQADLFRRRGRNRDTLRALNRAHRLFTQLRARRDLADIGRRVGRLEDEFLTVARRWSESIEAKDRYTQGHCQRVADLSCLIAERAGVEHGFDAQTMFWFRIGALLHDVGKLGLPEEVLNKPGKLTDEEWTLMRGHAAAGVDMLADIEFPWDIRPIVLSHHERWDGRGYPHGLAGDDIPLSARVLCVADVYDALTSVRSYKRAMSHDDAMAILRKDAGTAFDPQVVAWFEAAAPAWLARASDLVAAVAVRAETVAEPRENVPEAATALPDREAFLRECTSVLAARAADGRPTSVLLVTLSARSDRSAAVVAEALSRYTRGCDLVARYGPAEFVVLLPDVSAEQACAAATRVAEAAREALAAGGEDPRVVVCFAAAPTGCVSPAALVAAANAKRRRRSAGAA